ncbi:MAG: adenylyltransferase/cytidyltransferase family protein, partial [Candidatus Puniceispirillum sp.]
MTKRVIIYPGTFDPLTFGHMDIIRRGVSLGDKLIVAVSLNSGKKPLFSIDERTALVQHEIDRLQSDSQLTGPVE